MVSPCYPESWTRLNWCRSNDGLTLLMSSTDGFCSALSFAPGELGQVYNGPHPTYNHPTISTSIGNAPSANSTSAPTPTPTATVSPSFTAPVILSPSHPSPAPTFSFRPGSPTRSNSQSSIATISSLQTAGVTNNPTPTLSHVPLVTATNSAQQVGLPMTTPPQTPMSMSGGHSATSSISGSVLGKRDIGGASESEKEESRVKKRRVAPTPVNVPNCSGVTTIEAEKFE